MKVGRSAIRWCLVVLSSVALGWPAWLEVQASTTDYEVWLVDQHSSAGLS